METFRLQRLVYMYVFGLISSELHCLFRGSYPEVTTACSSQATLRIENIPGNVPNRGEGEERKCERDLAPSHTCSVCLHRREKRAWEVGSNRAMPSGGTGTSANAAPTAPAELTS